MCRKRECSPANADHRVELFQRVNRSHLRRLGDAQRARLGRVHIHAAPRRRRLREIDFAILAAEQEQLGPAGKEFRRAAFVCLDVCPLVAENAVERLTELGERERVGGRAVEDDERLAIGLERSREPALRHCRPAIVAIRETAASRFASAKAAQASGQMAAVLSLANWWRSFGIGRIPNRQTPARQTA